MLFPFSSRDKIHGMRKTLLPLILFFASPAFAMKWESNLHHIEPLLKGGEEAKECASEDLSPLKYISQEPKTEAWRSYYKMPKLLTADLYKPTEVCEEAKRMNAAQGVNREYAIIAHKSHFCDTGARGCISTLKSVSDPCNNFIQDNFQVFHTRTYVGSYRPSGSKEISDTYGQMGPSLLVIRLKDCKLVPTVKGSEAVSKGMSPEQAAAENYYFTPPSLDEAKDSKGETAFKSEDDRIRFMAMKESLIENIPELSKFKSGPVDCFENGKRSLPGIEDMKDVPYGKINIKGIVGIRKLMDEQLIETTGKTPYK